MLAKDQDSGSPAHTSPAEPSPALCPVFTQSFVEISLFLLTHLPLHKIVFGALANSRSSLALELMHSSLNPFESPALANTHHR